MKWGRKLYLTLKQRSVFKVCIYILHSMDTDGEEEHLVQFLWATDDSYGFTRGSDFKLRSEFFPFGQPEPNFSGSLHSLKLFLETMAHHFLINYIQEKHMQTS